MLAMNPKIKSINSNTSFILSLSLMYINTHIYYDYIHTHTQLFISKCSKYILNIILCGYGRHIPTGVSEKVHEQISNEKLMQNQCTAAPYGLPRGTMHRKNHHAHYIIRDTWNTHMLWKKYSDPLFVFFIRQLSSYAVRPDNISLPIQGW